MSDWPPQEQRFADAELVHAIGQVVITWSRAEMALRALAATIFSVHGTQSWALMLHVPDKVLEDAISCMLKEKMFCAETAEHIQAGLLWYRALNGARNAYAHSIYMNSGTNSPTFRMNSRARGALKHDVLPMELNEIRELAEEIFDLERYLEGTYQRIEARKEPPHPLGTLRFAPRGQHSPRRRIQQ
jgi:hypothetical protein